MFIEIDGKPVPKITNHMGFIDDSSEELKEVAFCVTDFGESNRNTFYINVISVVYLKHSCDVLLSPNLIAIVFLTNFIPLKIR